MKIVDLSIPGLKLIRLNVAQDERGYFKEFYHAPRYREHGIECPFPQSNLSFSKKDVIRGMHYQSDPGQAKLVSVLQGKIFDVALDIRSDSPYFGKWEGVFLDAEKHEQLFIPVGFAHGFCVVSPEGAYVHYQVSNPYNAATEKGFRFNDPFVKINWPTENPVISQRDQKAPLFREVFK